VPERRTALARATAVVAATTSWDAYPALWRRLLDEVHACVDSPGLNVMLYKDDVPYVEVGVLVEQPITPRGRVINSELPAGEVASIVHRGPYETLGEAHDAILNAGLELAGPRWEIYGHHRDDPAELETEVVYLLR
jgi:effector-binding domain-containing protein